MDVFKYLCHQRADRSFFYRGRQFPVCARCTGAYIGIFIGIIWYLLVLMPYDCNMLYLGIVLAIPAGIDGSTQYLEYRQSNNTLRLVTGLLMGIGLVIVAKCLKHKVIF